jgi:hypothetical protein
MFQRRRLGIITISLLKTWSHAVDLMYPLPAVSSNWYFTSSIPKTIATRCIYFSRASKCMDFRVKYKGCLRSSWFHLITPSRNLAEMWWRSLFRSISVGKRCTSYNAPPTSRKRAADRWSLRNFLPRCSLFMVGKVQKLHGARSELYGECSNWVPPIHFFHTKYRMNDRSFQSRQGLGTSFFTTVFRPALGPTQPPIQWVPGSPSLGVKRPGREGDHSSPSSAEVKECVKL